MALHHNCCFLLYPTHLLNPFDHEDLNPPYSPMPQMVVDLLWENFMPTELENSLRNSFKVLHHESLIYWNPILDELAHHVEDEG